MNEMAVRYVLICGSCKSKITELSREVMKHEQ